MSVKKHPHGHPDACVDDALRVLGLRDAEGTAVVYILPNVGSTWLVSVAKRERRRLPVRWLETDFGLYALCPDTYVTDWDGTEADVLRIDIPEGRYRVQSLVIAPSDEAEFRLGRLVSV
ncbi:hypothetical protein ABZY68_34290 [Streptomyces sp. NPDC006482]|uniref:hypothetical protein n=1 Tax=Streptomyces sp. NPDC006482 TaxID=3154306 RepID=UPI0033BD56C3